MPRLQASKKHRSLTSRGLGGSAAAVEAAADCAMMLGAAVKARRGREGVALGQGLQAGLAAERRRRLWWVGAISAMVIAPAMWECGEQLCCSTDLAAGCRRSANAGRAADRRWACAAAALRIVRSPISCLAAQQALGPKPSCMGAMIAAAEARTGAAPRDPGTCDSAGGDPTNRKERCGARWPATPALALLTAAADRPTATPSSGPPEQQRREPAGRPAATQAAAAVALPAVAAADSWWSSKLLDCALTSQQPCLS